MLRSQFAFLLLWTALFALGGAAVFRDEPAGGDWRGDLQGLAERQSAELRALHQNLLQDLARAPSGNAAPGGVSQLTREPVAVESTHDAAFLARLDALEQSLRELQDLLQRNDLSESDFAAHPVRPEAFLEAATLEEEVLASKYYGWDYRRVLAEFGAPAEARLTGNQQNIQWVYSVPPETFQFIFHDGRVARTNRWEE